MSPNMGANLGPIKKYILALACICRKKLIKVVIFRTWEGEENGGNECKRDFTMCNF